MKYTIEDLANGDVILLNDDATLEQLRGVLKKAFPNDYEIEEDESIYDYYFKDFNTHLHEWNYESFLTNINGEMKGKPIQSVKDFLEPYQVDWKEKSQIELIIFLKTYQKACKVMGKDKIDAETFVKLYK